MCVFPKVMILIMLMGGGETSSGGGGGGHSLHAVVNRSEERGVGKEGQY